jgi:hypothetical protein
MEKDRRNNITRCKRSAALKTHLHFALGPCQSAATVKRGHMSNDGYKITRIYDLYLLYEFLSFAELEESNGLKHYLDCIQREKMQSAIPQNMGHSS